MELFVTKLFTQPALYFSTVVSFAGSICVHEYCHALVADRLGDHTAKEAGYKTLNPMKVMGWMSIVALLVFGFSWGAVPVKREDSNRFRRSAIFLAGPLSNFVLLSAADAGEPNAMQFLGYQNGVLPDYGMKLEELLRRCWNESK